MILPKVTPKGVVDRYADLMKLSFVDLVAKPGDAYRVLGGDETTYVFAGPLYGWVTQYAYCDLQTLQALEEGTPAPPKPEGAINLDEKALQDYVKNLVFSQMRERDNFHNYTMREEYKKEFESVQAHRAFVEQSNKVFLEELKAIRKVLEELSRPVVLELKGMKDG